MPLTTEQIKIVNTYLTSAYENVSFDSAKKKITVLVDEADRSYRINILKQIQKKFSEVPFKATYTPSGGKTGAVKIQGLHIEVKSGEEKTKLKPSDIVPSIVNEWITSSGMVENTIKYIKSLNLEKKLEQDLIYLLEETGKDSKTSITFSDPKGIPAEFFEVLSSIKLAVLLKNNDRKIRKVLGVPEKMDLSKSKIKIYIPKKANFPLIDYYISVTASEKKDEETALKISVKSKVKSPKANTVKFKDVFDREKEVDDWYKGLNKPLQEKQKGPKIVAESALGVYGSYTGKALFGVPIVAMLNLMEKNKLKMKPLIDSEIGKLISFEDFHLVLKSLKTKITTISKTDDLSEVFPDKKDKEIYLKSTKLIQGFLFKSGGKKIENTVANIAYICERILVSASNKRSVTQHDYYQMFYDQVLTKKKIAYAVASAKKNVISYDFYSLVNFELEYKNWLSLRSKNSPNNLVDVIGIDV